jgi:hypothetical protein
LHGTLNSNYFNVIYGTNKINHNLQLYSISVVNTHRQSFNEVGNRFGARDIIFEYFSSEHRRKIQLGWKRPSAENMP